MSSFSRRIGLLTGTFDPVHLGHVAMARAAMEACELEQVWFLVNPAPDHKTDVTGLSDRLAMARLAIQDEQDLLLNAPTRPRMADLEALMVEYPQDLFVFVVGDDVLATMSAWEDYEAAVARGVFAVARRAGVPAFELDSRLKAQTFELAEHAGASSRTIQQQLAAGERPAELDERVYKYILERRLYRPAA